MIALPVALPTRFRWSMSLAILLGIGSGAVLCWFGATGFYWSSFSTQGPSVTVYLLLRVLFAAMLTWVVYSFGLATAWLVCSRRTLDSMPGVERYAGCFLLGAGGLHIVLLCLGVAGWLTYPVVLVLFAGVLVLSIRHLAWCIEQWGARPAPGPMQRVALVVLAAVAAVFVLVKTLYPSGGHDYFNHYFQYYRAVVEGKGLFNDIWYHFFYSKGAGLHFLGMLLTDPLAPSLVATTFVFCGSAITFAVLRRCSGRPILPYVGATLFLLMLIYTPGTGLTRAHGGWGELEKLHEITAIFIFGLFWAAIELSTAQKEGMRLWLAIAASCVAGIAIVTAPLAVFVGLFLVLMGAAMLLLRRYRSALVFLALAVWAGVCLLSILFLNYVETGIFLDQLLVQTWPFLDLKKVYQHGITLEVFSVHKKNTGLFANAKPLGWDTLPLLTGYLRLDIWWPILAAAASLLLVRAVQREGWSPRFESSRWTAFATFVVAVVVFALVGGGRSQEISFYRLTTFSYGPMLCATLVAFITLIAVRPPNPTRTGLPLVATFVGWAVVAWQAGHAELAQVIAGNFPTVLSNATKFASGEYSIEDAYRNQQGLAGRLPWGAIYPGIAEAMNKVDRGTPIWSFHLHSYCMLPGCNVRAFMSNRFSASWPVIFFGSSQEAREVLQREGLNYFFYSHALGVSDSVLRSRLFAPDEIKDNLAVAWTDGTSYLLTWPGPDTKLLDLAFVQEYRWNAIENNPNYGSFEMNLWADIAFHTREKGEHLRPFALPWHNLPVFADRLEPMLRAPALLQPVAIDPRSIKVSAATYGGNCSARMGNATKRVGVSCDGKLSCRYVVDHRRLGDPASGCAKDFKIEYLCGTVPHAVTIPGEAGMGSVVDIDCAGITVMPDEHRSQRH